MRSTIEDILYEAHKQGKRQLLLKSIPNFRQDFPNMSNEDLYQIAYDKISKT